MTENDILTFWFEEITPRDWFVKDEKLDESIRERFGRLYNEVVAGEKGAWRKTPGGALAEIIVLDQFSRNMFRDDARSFAQDTKAEQLTREALLRRDDKKLSKLKRRFLYMPLMHSESLATHQLAVKKFASLLSWQALKYELLHKKIIDRFGRYPHRNKVLGRESTPEEIEYLKTHKGF